MHLSLCTHLLSATVHVHKIQAKKSSCVFWQVQLMAMHQRLQLDAELKLNQLVLMMTMPLKRMMCSRSNNPLQQRAFMLHLQS